MNEEASKGRSKSIAGPFMPIFDRHDRKDASAARSGSRYNSWTEMLPIFFRGSHSQSNSPVTPSPLQKNMGSNTVDTLNGTKQNLEKDVRQGPLETDLFWLVLNDMGEPK